MKLIRYKRSESKLSDHRPVTATFIVEVEVFSPRKLQRALTYTDAEIKQNDIVTEMGHTHSVEIDHFDLDEVSILLLNGVKLADLVTIYIGAFFPVIIPLSEKTVFMNLVTPITFRKTTLLG